MKKIHKIQNVIAVIALGMAMYLANKIEITANEAICAVIMVILTIIMLLERVYKERNKEDSYDWSRKDIK